VEDKQCSDEEVDDWVYKSNMWGVNRKDLMISKLGLKGIQSKHMHINKC